MVICSWSKFSGYDISKRGDSRFTPSSAILSNKKSIEENYNTNIILLKEKDSNIDLWEEYLNLWRKWCFFRNDLTYQLLTEVRSHNGILRDRYAKSDFNHARALSIILNEIQLK